MHHALADDVSGAEAFANLFDISPEVRDPSPVDDRVADASAVTSSMGLLRQGLEKIRRNPEIIIESVGS